MQTVQTSNEVRKLLGHHLDYIRKLDPMVRERSKTDRFKGILIRQFGAKCSYCNEEGVVDAAHIRPLEIGAKTTEDNLILLCKTCHKNYDNGNLSINSMQRYAKAFKAGKRRGGVGDKIQQAPAQKGSITPPPKSLQSLLDSVGKEARLKRYVKASNMVRKEINRGSLSQDEVNYLTVKLAELTRRRAARNVLKQCLNHLLRIDENTVSKRYLPVFHYELGYVYRLLGQHSKALEIYKMSAGPRDENRSGVDYVAAETNVVLCEMSSYAALTVRQENDLTRRLDRLAAICRSSGGYWGGRWELNCLGHSLQVSIKAGNARTSWKKLKKVQAFYFDCDITSGWDAAAKQSMSLLEGLVFVLFPHSDEELNTGVELLARSFLNRFGYRQRLEGLRDAGIGLARGLEKNGGRRSMQVGKRLQDIMQRTIDGTSYIWPWRSDEDIA